MLALVASLVALLNVIWDPYDTLKSLYLEKYELNANKHPRMGKAYAVRSFEPKVVILGTSRAEQAIDPRHAAWGGARVYNLALPGQLIYEARRYLEHAHEAQELSTALIMLDLEMFRSDLKVQPEYQEQRLMTSPDGSRNPYPWSEILGLMFSTKGLWYELRLSNRRPGTTSYGQRKSGAYSFLVEERGHRGAFELQVKKFNQRQYTPAAYEERTQSGGLPGLEEIQRILDFCKRHGIKLYLAISLYTQPKPKFLWLTDCWAYTSDGKRA